MEKEQNMAIETVALRSLPDYRYINLEHVAGAAPEAQNQPQSFHIDYSVVPDLYQRHRGACTCHAASEVMIHRQYRLTGAIKQYSPRFTYTLCKMNDGVGNNTDGTPNEGTYCNMPFKMGVKFGFATEATCANDTTLAYADYVYQKTLANIPQAAFTEADQNRIPGYVQVGKFDNVTASDLLHALMTGLDGVKVMLGLGAEWYTSVDGTLSWDKRDIIPIRKMGAFVSNHDITVTGMETEAGTGRWKVYFRNHWSKAWAYLDNGWFYLDEHEIIEAWMPSEIPDPLLAIVKALPSQQTFSYVWNTNLGVGSRGPDVQNLQVALKIIGTFPFNQPVTDYFGPITKQAVMDFQTQYSIASPVDIQAAQGALGPKSRAGLNSIFSHK